MVLNPVGRNDRKRTQGDDGVVLVIFALALTSLMVMAALVIDLGNDRQVSRQAQASVDSAALAGAQYLPISATAPGLTTSQAAAREKAADFAADNIAERNVTVETAGCANGTPTGASCYKIAGSTSGISIAVKTPYELNGIASYGLIYVRACQPTEPTFGKVVGATRHDVCRSAVARNLAGTPSHPIGLLAMSELDACSGDAEGGAFIQVVGGAIVVNSSSAHALCGNGSHLQFKADYIGVRGGVNANPANTSPAPVTGIAQVSDPFAHLPTAPAVSEYPELLNVFTSRSAACPPPGQCRPGIYDFNVDTASEFLPGVVWLRRGMTLNGGDHVRSVANTTGLIGNLFYLPNSSVAAISVNGNPDMDLVPMASGTFKGMSIYQDRDSSNPLEVGGNPTARMGSIYALKGDVSNGGTTKLVVNGLIVADEFRVNGGGSEPINVEIRVPPDGPKLPGIPNLGLED